MISTTPDRVAGVPTDQSPTAVRDALLRLTGELTSRDFRVAIKKRSDGVLYLQVSNPRASILHESVYAQENAYWWSWWEKIADWDDAAAAAGILVRVLRTVGE